MQMRRLILTLFAVFNLTAATHANSIATANFNGDIDYTYDTKERLENETGTRCGGYNESNVWDAASSPTTFRSASGRTYNGANQRTNSGYSYDGNGNPTTYAGTTATFDNENRLLTFGSETYPYRADGLRASVGTGTSKVYYLYDGGNAVCQLDYQGNVLRTYVYAPDGMVGRTSSSQTRYYLFDWQGNLEHSMSSSTALNVSYAFNAWGQRNQKFPVNADVGANDQFAYNARWGYMKDVSTGFYYCQNRFYDPSNGMWLNRDPIGSGGMNLYGYCGGGPVGAIDRDGRAVETLWDLANVGMGLWDLGAALIDGDWGGAAAAGGGMLIDLAATALPGVPGGAGAARRGGRMLANLGATPPASPVNRMVSGSGSCPAPAWSSPGRRGGDAHRATVSQIEKDFDDAGYILISGGSKPEVLNKQVRRAPDLHMSHPDLGEVFVQIGKRRKKGTPVGREKRAISDLEKTGIPVIFIPYNFP